MFGITDDKGITTGRLGWARKFADEGTDSVVAAYPIPSGSTILSVNVDNLWVAHENMGFQQATIMGLHGFLVSSAQPYHGYGTNLAAYDSLWDDWIPKDRDVNDALDQYSDDSISNNHSMTIETNTDPVIGNMDSGTGSEANVSVLNLTASSGPECVFAREQRLDVTNGLIAKENEFRALDHVKSRLDKNYYLDDGRYWWLMFGVSHPKVSAISDLSWHPQTDLEWQSLAFPEIATLAAMLDSSTTNFQDVHQTTFGGALQSYVIEAGTYEDLGNVSGISNATNYCDIIVKYRRPKFEGVRADVLRQVG